MSRQQGIQDNVMLHLATGPAADSLELSQVLGIDRDKITNAIVRLIAHDWVAVDYRRNPTGGRAIYANIRLTDDGMRNLPEPVPHHLVGTGGYVSLKPNDATDYRNQPSRAPGGPVTRTVVTPKPTPPVIRVERVPEPTPASIGQPFPALASIRNRIHGTIPLRAAADALAKDDPLRQQIEKRINEQMHSLSPLEAEYLRYAQTHPS